MRDSDLFSFSKKLISVADLYSKSISQSALKLYYDSLRDFEAEEVLSAIDACVSNPDGGQFFPKPADVIRQMSGDSESRSIEAWRKVDNAIRRFGSYDSVVFDDAVIHLVISSMGGWIKLCKCEDKDYSFRSNEFMKSYRAYCRTKIDSDIPALTGIAHSHNKLAGHRVSDPVPIGNAEAAQKVREMIAKNSEISFKQLKLMSKQKQERRRLVTDDS